MESIENLKKLIAGGSALPGSIPGIQAYPRSLHELQGALFFMARTDAERFLVVTGNEMLPGFEGEAVSVASIPAKKCPLSPANAMELMKLFPFTAPVSNRGAAFSMGLGDRLGLASPGHIEAVRGRGSSPCWRSSPCAS